MRAAGYQRTDRFARCSASHHTQAHDWLRGNIAAGWASCPITQNGVVRIMSQPAYPQPVSPMRVSSLLRSATATEHHEFWPDDVSVLDEARIDVSQLHGPRQLTDAFLLALAVKHRGRFVTFDEAVPSTAVRGARPGNLVVL